MAYTTHGHYIPGTSPTHEDKKVVPLECGGIDECIYCSRQSEAYLAAYSDDHIKEQLVRKAETDFNARLAIAQLGYTQEQAQTILDRLKDNGFVLKERQ